MRGRILPAREQFDGPEQDRHRKQAAGQFQYKGASRF